LFSFLIALLQLAKISESKYSKQYRVQLFFFFNFLHEFYQAHKEQRVYKYFILSRSDIICILHVTKLKYSI